MTAAMAKENKRMQPADALPPGDGGERKGRNERKPKKKAAPALPSQIKNGEKHSEVRTKLWCQKKAHERMRLPSAPPRCEEAVRLDLANGRAHGRLAALCLQLAMVHILPDGLETIKEAGVAWRELNAALEYDGSVVSVTSNRQQKGKEKHCSYSIRRMIATRLGDRFVLKIPCGLIQGSSVTIIGTSRQKNYYWYSWWSSG